jgi:hypothetical protein
MRKQRYWLYRRGGIYYIHDSETGVRESLETRNKQEAEHIRQTRNMTAARPVIGMSLAKAYLTSQDPNLLKRTWQDVVDEFCNRGSEETQKHRRRVSKRRPQNLLLGMKLLETTNEDLIKILKAGGVMTNAFVRCLHNLALGLGWLAWPILPQKLWPEVKTKPKRAITREEHERIIAAKQTVPVQGLDPAAAGTALLFERKSRDCNAASSRTKWKGRWNIQIDCRKIIASVELF